MMWDASVNAICPRAQGTGSTAKITPVSPGQPTESTNPGGTAEDDVANARWLLMPRVTTTAPP